MTTTQERPAGADLTHWQPWSEMFPWNTRLSQVLDTLWHAADNADFAPSDFFEESTDAFQIELDLPGVARDDISLDIAGRRVTIHGTRKEKEHTGVLRRSTRVTGQFFYDLTLPTPVDESGVTATLTDGVLSVRLPKAQGEKTTRVAIS